MSLDNKEGSSLEGIASYHHGEYFQDPVHLKGPRRRWLSEQTRCLALVFECP